MKIDIDVEAVDGLIRSMLRNDLKMLRKEVRAKKHDPLINISDYRRYIEAMETLQEWYGE